MEEIMLILLCSSFSHRHLPCPFPHVPLSISSFSKEKKVEIGIKYTVNIDNHVFYIVLL